jgi:hypothetical protein
LGECSAEEHIAYTSHRRENKLVGRAITQVNMRRFVTVKPGVRSCGTSPTSLDH